MAIEVGIWRLGDKPERVSFEPINLERRLEGFLADDLSLVAPGLMAIGRQVRTASGGLIDLLAIDSEGRLSVIELKRHATSRDVVGQILDYGSWVRTLGYEDVARIYSERNGGTSFEAAFDESFGFSPPSDINLEHRLYIVAGELDGDTERIVTNLSEAYGVPINAVLFGYFRDGDREYLTRSWLVDPREASRPARSSGVGPSGEAWNGRDYYFAFGDNSHRDWEDARRYGYVSSGGGRKYTRPLENLTEGNRVFVCVPQRGYVGVGIVRGRPVPVTEFRVQVGGDWMPILEAPLETANLADHARDPEYYEYFVPVEWIKTVPVTGAIWDKGMFANQNIVCRLRNEFTLARLAERFDLNEDPKIDGGLVAT